MSKPFIYSAGFRQDDHAVVLIDSVGNFEVKTNGDPRALAAILRLIADDITQEAKA